MISVILVVACFCFFLIRLFTDRLNLFVVALVIFSFIIYFLGNLANTNMLKQDKATVESSLPGLELSLLKQQVAFMTLASYLEHKKEQKVMLSELTKLNRDQMVIKYGIDGDEETLSLVEGVFVLQKEIDEQREIVKKAFDHFEENNYSIFFINGSDFFDEQKEKARELGVSLE